MIAVGDRLPEAELREKTDQGPVAVDLADLTRGTKVVIFGLPGAFTPTCDSAHLPSFIRVRDDLAGKGVSHVVCVAVNDVHVMRRWGEEAGALDGGIRMLSDGDGAFTKALGLAYDNPAAGMFNRSKRYAMLVEDGVVTRFHLDDAPGTCALSSGEAMLAELA